MSTSGPIPANAIAALLREPVSEPLISIHDVMPETLGRVSDILEHLARAGATRPLLLVVPGRMWGAGQLAQLRAWAESGIILAGHGWTHESPPPRTFYHRIHGAILSRNVAEHLALDAESVAQLIRHNYAWFAEQYLPEPGLYVPPAWAMGRISRAKLAGLPYRYYETLAGIYDACEDLFHTLPLAGYEADTPLRALTLRGLNCVNRALARTWPRRLRIAIHPYDFDLRLRRDLEQMLANARNAN